MVIGRDEETTEFAEMLAELDAALMLARDESNYTAQRTAHVKLMFVLKNLNERLSKLERYQEGR
jgi:hypothetical protein